MAMQACTDVGCGTSRISKICTYVRKGSSRLSCSLPVPHDSHLLLLPTAQ